MNDKTKHVIDELKRSMDEFDNAANCLAQALQAFNERMERVESWIEAQKNQEVQ